MRQQSSDNRRKKVLAGLTEHLWGRLLLVLFIVLLFEVTAGNYSHWRSLLYEDYGPFNSVLSYVLTGENGGHDAEEGPTSETGEFTMDVQMGEPVEVHNLQVKILDMPEGAVWHMRMELADEGSGVYYELPMTTYLRGKERDWTVNLYPYGRVKEMRLHFWGDGNVPVTLAEYVFLNVRVPFRILYGRVLFLFLLGALWVLTDAKSDLWKTALRRGDKRQAAGTALVLAAIIALGFFLTRANPTMVHNTREHHLQYSMLAKAIEEGHVWVDDVPDAGVLAAENPYDTTSLQAAGIPYRADFAYFEGKYYVYFGIVPELMFYLPARLILHRDFPNWLAGFLCFAGFAASVFGLFYEASRRFFKGLPYGVYLTISGASVLFGNILYLVVRPDQYNVPDMAANMFTAAGVWLWLAASNRMRERGKGSVLLLAAGSFAMALVAGCRPQMLLFSFLAFPIFLPLLKEGQFGGKIGIIRLAAALLPYVPGAALVMVYNKLRFGSVLDFGAVYSMTNNDMTHRGFNLPRILYGLYAYLLKPISVSDRFPFLTATVADSSYMGKMVNEFTFGGVLAAHLLCWGLILLPLEWRYIQKKRDLAGLLALALIASLVIGAFDANGAGVLARYTADLVFGILLAVGLFWMWLWNTRSERLTEGFGQRFFRIALIAQLLYGMAVIFAIGDSINLQAQAPGMFYRVAEWFHL